MDRETPVNETVTATGARGDGDSGAMTSNPEVTRRRYVTGVGALAVASGLAGCSAGRGSTPSDSSPDATTETASPTGEDGPYTVSMAPVGEVTFESVPERWTSYFSTYGDMGIALGQAPNLAGMYFTDNYPTQFYDELGLDVDLEGIPQMNAENVDKEVFYDIGADVHLLDPNMLVNWFDWRQSDVDEVTENVGPFVGNMIRRHGDEWHDYRYYTLYEAFEKIASVFRQRDRYEEFRALHDPLIADLRSRLPPEEDRPEIGLLSVNSDFQKGSFWAYPIGESAGKKQYRDLGIRDAFDGFDRGGSFQLDYEGLLDVDPDALVFHFGVSHSSEAEFQEKMDLVRDDPAGRELSAVRGDRLYRGGTPYQGPIINLFQTELAAKQFYPDVFDEDKLFDRQRVTGIVEGDLPA